MLTLTIIAGLGAAFLTGALIEGGGYATLLYWLKSFFEWTDLRMPGWLQVLDLEHATETTDVAVGLKLLERHRLAKLVLCTWCTMAYVSGLLALSLVGFRIEFWVVWPAVGFVGVYALRKLGPKKSADSWPSNEPGE